MNDERAAYSVKEFLRAYSIGRTTLYAEIKAGRLRPVKIRRRTLIPVSEAQRWFASWSKDEGS